jgi:Pectate lyase superfamily protein
VSEPHEAVSRRRLLTLLGAGSAAVAVTQLSGPSAQSAEALGSTLDVPALRPEDYGAVGDGATDDTGALNAALDAARPDASPRGPGLVQLSGKTYAHSGEVVVPDGVQLNGTGSLSAAGGLAGSVLKATALAAMVHVRGSGSGVSNVLVDGNATAAIGIHTGGTAAGDDGSDHWYCNVVVTSAQGQNWLIEKTQNSTLINCRSNVAYREGVVIDRGVGGFVFTRCEFNSAFGGANLRIGANGTGVQGGFPSPTNLSFVNCQAEWRGTDGPEVRIEGGTSLRFDGLNVYHPWSGHTSPLIEVISAGRVTFVGLMAGAPGDKLRPAIRVGPGYSSIFPAVVTLAGETRCFGVSSLLDVKSLGRVMVSGPVSGLQGDAGSGITLTSTTTDPTCVTDDKQWLTDYRLTAATGTASLVERGFMQGEAQPRLLRDVNGAVQLGPGGSVPPDVSYQRQDLGGGASVLAIAPGVYAPRYVHPVLADVTPVSAAVTIDAAASDRHTVLLTSGCTSLALNNMVEGQYLSVLFKQPATASTFAIASVTGSGITTTQWQGGSAPALTAGGKAAACAFVRSGTVLYEVARSATTMPGWTAATLGANVVNYGNGYTDVAYQRTADGVRIRGTFTGSTTLAAKAKLFTLPTELRPVKNSVFACYGGAILVASNGTMQILAQVKAGAMCSLDGIQFSLD